MVPVEGANWAGLTCCGLLCGLTLALALGLLLFIRGRGAAALPLFQLLFDRNDAQDDALDGLSASGAPPARPDLRAIARQHDFDAAMRAQQEPPPFPPPPAGAGSPASPHTETRQRDEEEEWGSEDEPF